MAEPIDNLKSSPTNFELSAPQGLPLSYLTDPNRFNLSLLSVEPIIIDNLNSSYKAVFKSDDTGTSKYVPFNQIFTFLKNNTSSPLTALWRGSGAYGKSIIYETYYAGTEREYYGSPDLTLRLGVGDCVDASLFFGLLASNFNIPAKLVIGIGPYLNHAAVSYWNGEGWNTLSQVTLNVKPVDKLLPDGKTIIHGVIDGDPYSYDYRSSSGKGAITPEQAALYAMPQARTIYVAELPKEGKGKPSFYGIAFAPLQSALRSSVLSTGGIELLFSPKGMIPLLTDTEGFSRLFLGSKILNFTADSTGLAFEGALSTEKLYTDFAFRFDYNNLQSEGSYGYNPSQSPIGGLRTLEVSAGRKFYSSDRFDGLSMLLGATVFANFDSNFRANSSEDLDKTTALSNSSSSTTPSLKFVIPQGGGDIGTFFKVALLQQIGKRSIYTLFNTGLFTNLGVNSHTSTLGFLSALVVGAKLNQWEDSRGDYLALNSEIRAMEGASWNSKSGEFDGDAAWLFSTDLLFKVRGIIPLAAGFSLIGETHFNAIIDPSVRFADIPIPGFLFSTLHRSALQFRSSSFTAKLAFLSSAIVTAVAGSGVNADFRGPYLNDPRLGGELQLQTKLNSDISLGIQTTTGITNGNQFYWGGSAGINFSASALLGISVSGFIQSMSAAQEKEPNFGAMFFKGGINLGFSPRQTSSH